MKGKLPVTQLMDLESNESQWRMLANGLIGSLKTTAIITFTTELETEPKKIRINLVITSIFPPEHLRGINRCSTETNMGEDIATGLSRSREFLGDYLDKTAWLFTGYIDGENKVPILITYYQSIQLTIYTQKLAEEKNNSFFPDHRMN